MTKRIFDDSLPLVSNPLNERRKSSLDLLDSARDATVTERLYELGRLD